MTPTDALTRLPTQGRLAGDVDGDGRSDQVGLAVDRAAAPSCRYVLWVRTRGHVVARVVRQRESSELLHLAALVELARVTRGRGAQPVVDFGGGAYVAEYGLYDLVGGKLIRMGVLPLMPVFQNTFPSGGSNAGSEPSFCARGPGRGAVLVASFRFPHGPTHGDLYLQQGTTFKVVAWNRPLTALERQNWQTAPHGLRPEIFGDCAVAVAPR